MMEQNLALEWQWEEKDTFVADTPLGKASVSLRNRNGRYDLSYLDTYAVFVGNSFGARLAVEKALLARANEMIAQLTAKEDDRA